MPISRIIYSRVVRWERFFEDLEDQLDSEWEAERAVLDTEAERVRLSRIRMRDRFVALAAGGRSVSLDLTDGSALGGAVGAVGADWVALTSTGGADGVGGGPSSTVIVPTAAIVAAALDSGDVVASARDASAGSALRQRMTLGFVMRDLARKRVPVTVRCSSARTFSGTIDRAGADHLDLALHDVDASRRRDAVRGYRLIALSTVAFVRPEAPADVI